MVLYLGTPRIAALVMARMGSAHVANTQQVRRWLRDEGLCLEDCEVDHIVPRALGGVDHPYNYALVRRDLNRQWSANWTADKRRELGPCAVQQALAFAQWSTAQSTVPYSTFAP